MKIGVDEAYKLLEASPDTRYKDIVEMFLIKIRSFASLECDDPRGEIRKICTAFHRVWLKRKKSLSDDSSIDLIPDNVIYELLKSLFTEGINILDLNEDSAESDASADTVILEHNYNLPQADKDILHYFDSKSTNEAEQSISERNEEKEKRIKAKKKAKKKRRKEKKKLQKQNSYLLPKSQSPPTQAVGSPDRCNEEESSEEDLDPNSAFFATAASNKKMQANSTSPKEAEAMALSEILQSLELPRDVIHARRMAINGNILAKNQHPKLAVTMFTEAIKLDPLEYRYYCNRSCCFEMSGQYKEALQDAQKAICLIPECPKGHYRKGAALKGLKKYQEAEASFEQVLKLDKNCIEVLEDLQNVRLLQLIDMGFEEDEAAAALNKHGNISDAVENLLFGSMEQLDDLTINVCGKHSAPSVLPDEKMDPTNPNNHSSLWVGNILPRAEEKDLASLFSGYGPVESVHILREKFCAFVNFKGPTYAGKAMENLQGIEFEGQKLKIRFPDRPATFTGPQRSLVFRKTTPSSGEPLQTIRTNNHRRQLPGPVEDARRHGHINGNECYFWRANGCAFGDKCRNYHIPENKGKDRKP